MNLEKPHARYSETMGKIAKLISDDSPSLVRVLSDLVEIPSISSLPQNSKDVRRSAEYVRDLFASLGMDAEIRVAKNPDGSDGRPAILARKHVGDEFPTVLLYAHHDVQPIGETSRWKYEPLALTEVGDRLYGRGSADCGMGIVVHYGAMKHLAKDLPINVTVFIEGEEEVGSPSFENFLETFKEELRSDVIIVADSNNWTVDTPALTSSLRGVVDVDVHVKVLEHAVHSGMFGGPILDAVILASKLIASLHDDAGNVAVEGLGGTDTADVVWAESDFRRDAGIVPGYELAGEGDLAARVWTKPAIGVIGMDVRPTAEASNTIAPECSFRLSVRTVPGTAPKDSYEAVKRHLEKNRPFGVEMTVTSGEQGPGYLATDGDASKRFALSLKEAWGTDPVSIGVGGSIPFISTFAEAFPSAEILVTGVEDPASNAHSEDESASRFVLERATIAEALFLESLATSK